MISERKADILLVDDTPANLLALEAILADLGQHLVKANSGKEALRYLMDHEAAAILMDVQMPGMDGFETATLIRQRERSRYMPIVFLTAYEQTDTQLFRGYAAGAVDFLTKPFVPAVLRSKVSVFVELYQKTDQIRQQSERLRQIERIEHERQLAAAQEHLEQERLRGELRIARRVQQQLFPSAPPPAAGFEISGASHPAEATGGDFYDYIPMQDGGLAVVIGDVSGHGFGPALLMAELRAYLRALLLTRTDVGEIMALLNGALEHDTPDGHFATLLLARLDPATRTVVYSSAGHLPGYHISPEGELKAVLNSTGIPLGIISDGSFPAVVVPPLEPGDLLLMFTDGMIEAHDSNDVMFGVDRLLGVVRSHLSKSPQAISEAMYAAVRAYCGSRPPADDMTVIVVKANP